MLHRFTPFLRRSLSLGRAGLLLGFVVSPAHASFRDDFDRPVVRDPSATANWNFFAGDGAATIDFSAHDGLGRVSVDATADRRGIWWAIVQREISSHLDLARLAGPGTELQVEARVRASHAPRRVNLSFNTQRTTDYHTNLMEFDLAEANTWQTIRFTTEGFDGRPGDKINVQLALMDWGLGRYRVDIDYLKVEVVDRATAGPDLGSPVPYHPPLADPATLQESVPAAAVATIDRREPDATLADWAEISPAGPVPIVSVNGSQIAIMRWDLSAYAGRAIAGSGLLELTTHAVQRPAGRRKDFGLIRVVEILGGARAWDAETVSYERLTGGQPYEDVFNTQMIIDVEVNDAFGGSTWITLPRPVLQRLIDGRTRGIALIPLGSIAAAFAVPPSGPAPLLHFNVAAKNP